MKEKVTDQDVHKALQQIVDHADEKAVNWAVNYAKHGLWCVGHDLYVQVLYVIGNIQYWRGTVSKEVRETLRAYLRQYKQEEKEAKRQKMYTNNH